MNKDELFLRRVSMDTYLLRAKASFMADFYMGVENIFRTISEELNGGVPRGDGWHKRLLTWKIFLREIKAFCAFLDGDRR